MDGRFIYEPEVKALLDAFSSAFAVKITFFSPSGDSWLFGCSAEGGEYCALMQKRFGLLSRCRTQDGRMCAECGKQSERIVYTCYSGLSEAIVPIFAEGKLLFYAMIGQFRIQSSPSAEILSLCPEEERAHLLKVFLSVPLFSPSGRDAMLSLFQKTVSMLIKTEQVRKGRTSLFDLVSDYVRTHIGEDIRIEEVARCAGRSSSSVSHAVKNRAGMSFKEYVTEEKLRAFERLAVEDGEISIKEAAARLGYRDSLYFSRLYRRKRGFPPSVYRLKAQNSEDRIGH
jgi:AraC-type DNA-binding domain-containing proteins